MGEALFRDVVGELLRQLMIGEEPFALLGHATPRPEVHLVHGHRHGVGGPAPALGHPLGVLPLIAVEVVDHRGGARLIGLEGEGEGVGLQREGLARARDDLVLVAGALGHTRHEELPDAVAGVQAHGMAAAIPAVPVADHAHPLGVRRPHGEDDAVDLLQARRVRAELVVDAVVGALAEQMKIVAGQRRGEPVGVLDLPDVAAVIDHPEAVPICHLFGHRHRPETGGMQGLQRVRPTVPVLRDQEHLAGLGQEGADRHAAVPVAVRSEHGEGIAVLTRCEGMNDFARKLHSLIVPDMQNLGPFRWCESRPCSTGRDSPLPRSSP